MIAYLPGMKQPGKASALNLGLVIQTANFFLVYLSDAFQMSPGQQERHLNDRSGGKLFTIGLKKRLLPAAVEVKCILAI
jgi:hypothetical protein